MDFIKLMQKKVSKAAIGPSAMRSQGLFVVRKAQDFCTEKISLEKYGKCTSEEQFLELLDKDTERLKARGMKWGSARKAINLVLRDAAYNVYLRDEYKLARIESYLEIPLDAKVGKRLEILDSEAPKWTTIKALTPEKSSQYQKTAKRYAAKNKTKRVHLDVKFWTD